MEKGLHEGLQFSQCACTIDILGGFLHKHLYSYVTDFTAKDYKGAFQHYVIKQLPGVFPVYKVERTFCGANLSRRKNQRKWLSM